jgi:hypothetical protein
MMQAQKKGESYLTFVEKRDPTSTRKLPAWQVRSSAYPDRAPLGYIMWWSGWRRYCFFPEAKSLFDASCLKEIEAFITTQMEVYKCQRASKKTISKKAT